MARNNNRILNPNARGAMDRLKMETANEVGVQLKEGYNGDIKSKDAGTIGGNMVKKMIQAYENKL
jgi:small acid-soluble spore protein D (minor alpha/beta-type SASP)